MRDWYNDQNVHVCHLVHFRRVDSMIARRNSLRQKVRGDSGDLAITESIDRNWHPLQHLEERGLSAALVLLERGRLGFNCFFPDGVLLVGGH